MKKNSKKKVFIAMSGGVDSSVAALLLKKKGYSVVGVFMRCYNIDGCAEKDVEDARRVAEKLKIPFYVWDFEEEYKKKVVEYMVKGYKQGITPNPDVMCNREIKFGLFLEKALKMGADYVATGHYVRIEREFSMTNNQFSKKIKKQKSTVLPAGESHKTLNTISHLYDEFLKHDLDRGSIVVAVGGGVIGDMAGFAAATFMRGLRWVNVPTTLLAMVDASIGGKTGVDLLQGKNLVGAFHAPSLVIIDPLMLNTLPRREYNAGMAEVIKHGIICDAGLFESLEDGKGFGSPAQIAQALQVKIDVVQRDPFEKGERAILNVGHTIGHGVEAASHFELRHGEAIAIGLIAEARLAEQIGIAESGLADRIEKVIERFKLPTRFNGDPETVRALMQSDKKKSRGKLKFALPKKIGEAVWGVEVDEGVLMEVLRQITAPRAEHRVVRDA